MTVAAVDGAGRSRDEVTARVRRRLGSLAVRPLPIFDPQPTGATADRLGRAAGRLRAGGRGRGRADPRRRAREARARPRGIGRGPVRARSGGDVRCAPRALSVLLLLLRRHTRGRVPRRQPGAPGAAPGRRRACVALAGSTRRSADPAVDDHLGEQLMQSQKPRGARDRRPADRQTCARGAVWVEAEAEPGLIKVANIQHLATPVRAQLAEPLSAVELAALLHPTPAVGGEPASRGRADRRARAHRPRLVRRTGRVDGRGRGRRVLRRTALRAAPRPGRAPVRGRRDRRRLRPRGRARRDRAQARRDAAAAERLGDPESSNRVPGTFRRGRGRRRRLPRR